MQAVGPHVDELAVHDDARRGRPAHRLVGTGDRDDQQDGQDSLVFQVDLFSARGVLPRDIQEVMARHKDIIYSSRTRYNTDVHRKTNQLKHALETTGVTVDKLQVQQAPKSEQPTGGDDQQQQQQQPGGDDHAARQEQQRKEMLRRMWRRVSGAGDPLDFLA